MKPRRSRIVLPDPQWASQGWSVEWRHGNAYRDRYEVCYRVQFEGYVYVTRQGWKWAEFDARYSVLRRSAHPMVWSPQVFDTWHEAVAAYARRLRVRAKRRGELEVLLPRVWTSVARSGRWPRTPWVPRPVHDDFTVLEEKPVA